VPVAPAANAYDVAGVPHGRFARAIRDRHLQRAIMAAHELNHVTLDDALELTILAAEIGDERWPKLAARWQSRFVSETPGIGAAESAWVFAGVGALGGPFHELAADPCGISLDPRAEAATEGANPRAQARLAMRHALMFAARSLRETFSRKERSWRSQFQQAATSPQARTNALSAATSFKSAPRNTCHPAPSAAMANTKPSAAATASKTRTQAAKRTAAAAALRRPLALHLVTPVAAVLRLNEPRSPCT
jgi:hypothetical protein